MKAPIVIKIKSLQFLVLLIAAGILTTSRALAVVEVWNGGNFVSVTTNWSDTANWLPVGTPGSADTAVFGATGTGTDGVTVNNALTANTTVAGLQYTNTTSGAWHVTQIPAGTTLTVTGPTIIGGATNNGLLSSVAFVDAGTLSLAGNLTVGNNGSSSADQNTLLDLSGLTNFVYNNSGGTITIGFGNRSSANWKLASGSNSITVGTVNANATSTSSGVSGTVTLGGGTNIINVGTLNAAVARNNSTITFPATGAGLRLRGVGGTDTDRATLILANRNQNTSGGNNTGTFNFNGNSVDMKFGTMTIGEATAATPSASQSGIGIINFDTGIIDATTINMAISTANANNIGTGTINVGATATLVVSNLSLVNQGPLATGTSVGNLNITGGGGVNCSGNIFKTTTAGTGNITITTGSLNMGSGAIGTSALPIDTLSVANSTMTLSANLTADVFANTLTASGSANTINVTSLPTFFAYPVQFPLISFVNVGGDNSTFVVGTLPGTFKGYISNNTSSIDVVITNGPSLQTLKSINWNGTPTGDWTTNVATLNWLTNSTAVNYNQGDTVTFNDSLTGTTNVNLTQVLTPGGLTVNNSSAHYIFTGAGRISGSASLTKTGNGTLILDNSGTNDFVGPVTISNGTLQVGNNDANGNLPLQSWDVEGTLAFNRTDNVPLQRIITGAGSLVQNGSGTISLTAANTYSGNTVVNRGTLALTGAGSIANSAQTIAQTGAFDVSAAAPSISLNPVALSSGGVFIVDTNTVSVSTLSSTNSTIRLVPNAAAGPTLTINNLTTGGATNYINITGIQNAPGSAAEIPIISYTTANFSGGFNFGLTNFPNAYITNNTSGNTIDLVLTTAPFIVTWNGGSATGNNWSDSNNWNGVSIFANDALFFDGSARLNPVNDTAAGTTYSNITFNGGASSFTLTGNPIAVTGTIENDSANPQTVNLGVNFANGISINGTAGPLIIGGGLTNTHGPLGFTTNTFAGTGILTNLLGNPSNGTNVFLVNDSSANWTLMDNASSTTNTVSWNFEFNNGTFNFGSATSAPKVVSTSIQGSPQDNQIGNSATAVLNFSNGVFTTTARLNTGAGSGNGTINQYGGTFTIGSQFQGANGSASASSTVNLYGGTMNIGSVTNPTGQFYIASRGPGTLTVTNSAVLNCGILDVSRSINANIPGTVNLDGGSIVATSVGTATASAGGTTTGSTATFNFNGGALKARTNSTAFFRGSTVAPIVPITAIVKAGGAIIDSDVFSITDTDPLLTDPNLLGAADGGFKKLGTGTLTMLGTNTYIGDTLVTAGTLIVNGVQGQSRVIVSSGATLGGNGVIGSNVTVNAGGAVSPGNNGVGTLTVAGNVSLAGTTTMEIDKVGATNDLLLATNSTPSTITYSGTLSVVTVAGSLAPGDTFTLFSASNYVGSFTVINPPNVTWNTNNLNVNGTLTVVSVAPAGPTTNATITKVSLSGTNLLVHGTNNNVPNNTLHYVVLTSTNIATPLSNWAPVLTNIYNGDGTFDFTNAIVPGTPNQFIDIKAVP